MKITELYVHSMVEKYILIQINKIYYYLLIMSFIYKTYDK